MKKYDCFTFLNEIELLEFRLKLLGDYFDYFVIIESNLTFSGKEKSYFYKDHEARFDKWKAKIIYYPLVQKVTEFTIADPTSKKPSYNAWLSEYQQRNAIREVVRAGENDMIFLGDLDEIPDPYILKKIKNTSFPQVFSMKFHYYFMNCGLVSAKEKWNGTVVMNGEYFYSNTPQHIRRNRDLYKKIKGGWHFSYLGGIEKIKYKIQSFSHTEYDTEEFLNDTHILNSLENGVDFLKRHEMKFYFFPILFYRYKTRKLIKQYPAFIRKTSILKWLLCRLLPSSSR